MSIDKVEQLQVRVENAFSSFLAGAQGSLRSDSVTYTAGRDSGALRIVFSDFMTKIIEH